MSDLLSDGMDLMMDTLGIEVVLRGPYRDDLTVKAVYVSPVTTIRFDDALGTEARYSRTIAFAPQSIAPTTRGASALSDWKTVLIPSESGDGAPLVGATYEEWSLEFPPQHISSQLVVFNAKLSAALQAEKARFRK